MYVSLIAYTYEAYPIRKHEWTLLADWPREQNPLSELSKTKALPKL